MEKAIHVSASAAVYTGFGAFCSRDNGAGETGSAFSFGVQGAAIAQFPARSAIPAIVTLFRSGSELLTVDCQTPPGGFCRQPRSAALFPTFMGSNSWRV